MSGKHVRISDLARTEDLAMFGDLSAPVCDACGEFWPAHPRTEACRAGCCAIMRCYCGAALVSWGPVDCWACGRGYRSPGVRAMRQLYRAEAEGASLVTDRNTYHVRWSDEDECYIATVEEYPSLSFGAEGHDEALMELKKVVAACEEDLSRDA